MCAAHSIPRCVQSYDPGRGTYTPCGGFRCLCFCSGRVYLRSGGADSARSLDNDHIKRAHDLAACRLGSANHTGAQHHYDHDFIDYSAARGDLAGRRSTGPPRTHGDGSIQLARRSPAFG
jgi:hypothetical protein